jgi:NitT/TauT family transport system substrate-binding protein
MKLLPRLTQRMFAAMATAVALSLVAAPTRAQAEGQILIAEQFGVVYLLLNIAQDLKLIEKNARAAGLDTVKVEFVKLSGGPAINDALLAGHIDVAAAGIGPLLTIWDRTQGKQNVRGIATLGNFPNYLITINPSVRSLDDLSERDRIATPAATVSVQSRILQLASARRWGDAQFNKLDKLQVTLPHPDATAALIKGGTESTTHFSSTPYQEQLLAANPRLITYGPYFERGVTAPSNLAFDESLRARDPRWGVRELNDVVAEAHRAGLVLAQRHSMPANNLLLVFSPS